MLGTYFLTPFLDFHFTPVGEAAMCFITHIQIAMTRC